jgi:intraflagellar transport protein 74
MERPASRGLLSGVGKAPTGSAIPVPDRPGTASRGGAPPGTASGRPPGTAMRGQAGQPPPSTAYMRLGTASGRPGTGAQGAAAAGARTGTAVQVEARPITQHGISGMKTAATAVVGGRKVLDKNYFLSELLQKRSEIANITQSMREEVEALEKRQSQYNSMEKRGTELTKEVKAMQETLADYNTVLDKVGLGDFPACHKAGARKQSAIMLHFRERKVP